MLLSLADFWRFRTTRFSLTSEPRLLRPEDATLLVRALSPEEFLHEGFSLNLFLNATSWGFDIINSCWALCDLFRSCLTGDFWISEAWRFLNTQGLFSFTPFTKTVSKKFVSSSMLSSSKFSDKFPPSSLVYIVRSTVISPSTLLEDFPSCSH